MNMHFSRSWPSTLAKTLCVRYLAAHIARFQVQIGSPQQRTVRQVRLMLGTTNDGQHEILGWWAASLDRDTDWSEIADDLHLRGMEHICFVDFVPDVRAAFKADAKTELDVAKRALAVDALAPALGTVLKRRSDHAAGIAQTIQLALTKAMHRSSSRAMPENVALDRLDERVQRLDRRLWSSAPPVLQRGCESSSATIRRSRSSAALP